MINLVYVTYSYITSEIKPAPHLIFVKNNKQIYLRGTVSIVSYQIG